MEEIYRKYARLMLQVGVNLQQNQKLHVSMEVCHAEFAEILTEEAYRLGAGYVLLELDQPRAVAARVKYSSEANLSYIAPWKELANNSMIREEWARLRFYGPAEPSLMGKLDQTKLALLQAATRKAMKVISKASGVGDVAWSVGVLPTEEWAQAVFPQMDSKLALETLWKHLIEILYLKDDNPSDKWQKISEKTIAVSEKLTELHLEELHFKSEQTDLIVGCFKNSVWMGGGMKCQGRYNFSPNVPSFENFTTPDFRRTTGHMQTTRCTEVMGSQVEGAWFKFEKGKVVDYGAKKNMEVLEKMFKICPQSRFLGEAALVDNSSPIYQSGEMFRSVLLDENASCHVALGSGYPAAAAGAHGKTDDELLAMGCNVSLVHHDFMIGTDDLCLIATLSNGEKVKLIDQGGYTDILR